MKKILFAFFVLFLGSKLHALNFNGEVSREVPRVHDYISEGVYQVSYTCTSSDFASVWLSSPSPAILYSINVSSPGTGEPTIEIWDGGGVNIATGTGARLVDRLQGDIRDQYFYNVGFSSMLAVNSQVIVGNPPCYSVIFKRR